MKITIFSCYDLEKTDRLDPKKEHIKTRVKWMYMIQLQNYIMSSEKSILIDTIVVYFWGVSKHFGLGVLKHFVLKNVTKRIKKTYLFHSLSTINEL